MEPKYCAQGVCMNHGSCLSDSDCVNPSNLFGVTRSAWDICIAPAKAVAIVIAEKFAKMDRSPLIALPIPAIRNPCVMRPPRVSWTLAMGNALLCTLIKPAKYWTAALPGISMQTQARLETQPLIQKITK